MPRLPPSDLQLHPAQPKASLLQDDETYWLCPMNGKYIHAEGDDARVLRAVGIGGDSSRRLAVVDPKVCNAVFGELARLRAHLMNRTSLPKGVQPLTPEEVKQCRDITKGWPRWLRHLSTKVFSRVSRTSREKHTTVDSMLATASHDFAYVIQQLFEQRFQQIQAQAQARDIQNTVEMDRCSPSKVEDPTQTTTDIEKPLVAHAAATSSQGTKAPLQEMGPSLNEEQVRALRLIESGYNVYIGGNAGTGKTVLIRAAQRKLESMGLRVAVTATTGIAGCHIGGTTFHHALGVNLNGEFTRRQTMLAYDVVIVDEISMMSKQLFEEFDSVAKAETGCTDLPFGGIQVIVVGDFLQLSAINEVSVFHSQIFKQHFLLCKLTTQVRQAENAFFAEQLAIMRQGIVPTELMKRIKTLPSGVLEPNAINLLPTNAQVRAANTTALERLAGETIVFSAVPQPPSILKRTSPTVVLQTTSPSVVFDTKAFEGCLIAHLDAAVGWPHNAYVSIYQQNDDAYACRLIYPDGAADEWVVGCNAALMNFVPKVSSVTTAVRVFELYTDSRGRHPVNIEETFDAMVEKLPLGSKLEIKIGAKVLLRSNLTVGLVNGTLGTVVGFAPCRLESIPQYLRDDRVAETIAKYHAFCLYERLCEPMLPVVKFHSGEEVAIPPITISVGGYALTHHYSASIIALPLTLAYAFTVHKVQGLTLVGRVHLELSKMWPCNHLLYVAFSRVKNLDQLSVSAFSPEMLVADVKATEFDSALKSVQEPHMPPEATVAFWKAIQLQSQFGKSFDQILNATKQSNGWTASNDALSTPAIATTSAATTDQTKKTKLSAKERRIRKVIKNVTKRNEKKLNI